LSTMYDAIIIGAGMSGLAAGIRLAMFGRRVCILEQHGVVGGLNSYYSRRGREFDVGLHALTNFTPAGSHRGPLVQMLRQLRIGRNELQLTPQLGSAICFPGATLRFSNDFELLESEIRRLFPRQIDNFRRLVAELADYDRLGKTADHPPARRTMESLIGDPLLVEMLCCPIFFYGGARAGDMDFDIFSILFRSIFLEGLARPSHGVRTILDKLLEKYRGLGGELRLRAKVGRIVANDATVEKIVLEDGAELDAKRVLSSAGWPETARLCGREAPADQISGRMAFVETISVLAAKPQSLGHQHTMVFFNDSDEFHFGKPADAVDVRSGLICCSDNFAEAQPGGEGTVRVSAQANFDRWAEMDETTYRAEKDRWYEQLTASAIRFMPDFRDSVLDTDMFTPLTIRRYTGHDNGAIYGSPDKLHDGTTPWKNLFICGNDQGLIGIVGTIISGITVANRHFLLDT
jgi:phytoene dehydrogenase-like protein